MLLAKFAGFRTCFQLGDELVNRLTLLFAPSKLVSFEHSVLSGVDIALKLLL